MSGGIGVLDLTSSDLHVIPALEEARALAGEHNLIPVHHTFVEDCETPVSAFLKLRGDGPAFLLESAEQGQRVGRWSFIGWGPRRVLRWSLSDGGDPYAIAAAAVADHRQAPVPALPPMAGGAVGSFAFDCVRAVERLPEPNPDVIGLPDMALMLSDVIVAFDHLRHTVTILANAYLDDEGGLDAAHARAVDAIRAVRARLAGPLPPPPARPSRPRPPPPSPPRRAPSRGSSPTSRASGSRRWSRASSSTSTPATPTRSSPPSAGRRPRRWSRSRSTGACAPSTRARTCTSSTSRTSSSSARARSPCSPSPAATCRPARSPARARAARTTPGS